MEFRPAASEANETWVGDELVVRVNWRGDIGRLRREAEIASAIPPQAKHPGVLAFGDDGDIEWLVLRRVPGIVLSRAWPDLLDRLGVLHISRELSLLAEHPRTGPREPNDPRDRRNHLRAVPDGTSSVLKLAR